MFAAVRMRGVILVESSSSDVSSPYQLQYRTDLQVPNNPDINTHSIVQVHYVSLNRRDYWMTQGLYPKIISGSIIGSDCSGVVVSGNSQWNGQQVVVNSGVDFGNKTTGQNLQFGVLGMLPLPGTLCEYLLISNNQLHRLPSTLSLQQSSTLPVAALTAYRAAFTQSNIKSNQLVLITGAGGGVSTFLISFAVAAGSHVIVTSSSQHKIQQAITMGAKHGFNYKQKTFIGEVQQYCAVHGYSGIDVVIDGSGGELLNSYIKLLAIGGTICIYGATASQQLTTPVLLHSLFLKQIKLIGSTMGSSREFSDMIQFIDQHSIQPLIHKIFKLNEIDDAMHMLKNSTQMGKIVIDVVHGNTNTSKL